MVRILTDLSFLDIGKKWPPPSEKERLERYANNKLLFEADHDQVFKEWIRILREDQQAILHIIFNWHKILSLLWADLLLSEPPRITAGKDKSEEQKEAENIVEDNSLITTAHEVTIDVSRYGTGIYFVYNDGTRGVIEPTQPRIWFPVVEIDNVKRIKYHVLAWTYDVGEGDSKKTYLKVQVHEKGKYTIREYQIVDGFIKIEITTPQIVMTGLSDFAVVPVHNTLTSDRVIGMDDYKDIDTIIQELEIRVGQISRILDKHSDPNMYGDESALEDDPETGEAYFRGGGKYFPVPPGGTPPGYVTFASQAQMDANWKEIELLMQQLYIVSETSEACFGQLKQGMVESGSALKRLLIKPLAKAQRIRMRMDPALKKAIKLCSEINGGKKLDKVSIAWQDGIPTDELEMSNVMAVRTGATGGARTISTYTAIRRLDNKTDSEVQEEMDRIAEDEEAMNPTPGIGFDKNTDLNNSPVGGDV